MPTGFVVSALVLSVLCVSFVVWPVFNKGRGSARVVIPTVFSVLAIFGAYYFYTQNSQWNWRPFGVPKNPAAEQLYSLQRAVHDDEDSHQAWSELGKFYLQYEQIQPAQDALSRAVQLTAGRDIELNLNLVEALSATSGQLDQQRLEQLIGASLRIDPDHRKALWYGGEIAASQQNYAVAIVRWGRLLADSEKRDSPEAQSVTQLLSQRIASTKALMAQSLSGGAEAIVINASIDSDMVGQLSGTTPVFILARAQGQPGPPLAVHRTLVSELPLSVTLSDKNAMLPTRKLSDFESIEVVVRAAVGGTPTAQSGDYFGLAQIGPENNRTLSIVINQKKP